MAARRMLIAGNWKMHTTTSEAERLSQELVRLAPKNEEVEIALCPPFTALAAVARVLRGTRILLGAQNMHWEARGPYTGEISAAMLKDLGCQLVILGHSERRMEAGETDSVVHRKMCRALEENLTAILCVGETLPQREQGKMWSVIERQLSLGLEGVLSPTTCLKVIIAYEPVWAIGTGKNATPAQAQEIHGKIREWLSRTGSEGVASRVRIQYGGSVKAENAEELLSQPDVDGALVGGASLDPKAFFSILEAAVRIQKARCIPSSS